VTRQWAFSGPPSTDGFGASSVTLIEGSAFCISGPGGDIVPGGSQGLFVRDTRVVSRWELTLDDTAPSLLTVQHGEPFAATFLSRVAPRPGLADSTLLVVRRRYHPAGAADDVGTTDQAQVRAGQPGPCAQADQPRRASAARPWAGHPPICLTRLSRQPVPSTRQPAPSLQATAVAALIMGGSTCMIGSFASYAAAPSGPSYDAGDGAPDAGLTGDGRAGGTPVALHGVMCWKPSGGGRHEHLQGN